MERRLQVSRESRSYLHTPRCFYGVSASWSLPGGLGFCGKAKEQGVTGGLGPSGLNPIWRLWSHCGLNHVWKWFDEVHLLCSVCFIYHLLFHLSSFHLSSIVSFGLLVSFCFLNPPSADHLGTIITKFTKPSKMLAKNAIFPKPFGLKKKSTSLFPNLPKLSRNVQHQA